MAASVSQIMGGLETRLATVSGLHVKDYAPGSPNLPGAFPLVPPIDYRATMGRGKYVIPFQVALVVSAALDRVGQHLLAELTSQTGDRSIRAALEGDKTLGGLVDDCVVDTFDPQGLMQVGLIDQFGGVFNLRVIATGV